MQQPLNSQLPTAFAKNSPSRLHCPKYHPRNFHGTFQADKHKKFPHNSRGFTALCKRHSADPRADTHTCLPTDMTQGWGLSPLCFSCANPHA